MPRNIKELDLKELEQLLEEWGEPRFHAGQVFSWIYQKGASSFDEMSNLSARLRKRLEESFFLSGLKQTKALKSSDGTQKLLFTLADGNLVEAVIIPVDERVTGCVSTQVGCKFACCFCASGMLG
ncbi:MAG: 23S rRNA (adenine(2503)-C(2))-methyltransferase RlmN, partial [Candidatus Omnitrophota bacterium]